MNLKERLQLVADTLGWNWKLLVLVGTLDVALIVLIVILLTR